MNAWKILKSGTISYIERGVNIGIHLDVGDIIFTDICGQVEVKTDKHPYKSIIADCIRLVKVIHFEDDEVQNYDNINFIYPRIANRAILNTIGIYIEKNLEWEREEKLKNIFTNI